MRLFDRLTFGWVTHLIFSGYSSKSDHRLDAHLREHVGAAKRYDTDRLLRDILWSHRYALLISALLKLASEIITVYSVDVMRQAAAALKKLAESGGPYSQLSYLLGLLLGLQVLNTFCMNHQEFAMTKVGLRCSRSLLFRLFASSLRHTSPAALHEGRLVNMMTVDVQRLENMFANLNYVWSAPLQCALIFWHLYKLIGWVALFGFVVMFLYVPAQYASTLALKHARQVTEKLWASSYVFRRLWVVRTRE
jgi:ABC-type multidrug transport system fused ATPase/permease subunit